jgi:hypothetical protein
MDHEILKYSDDFENHIDQIARLKTINWGLDFDVFRSYVKWNYIDRPHSKPPIIYFVRVGGEIVAMRGAYETTWQLKNASAHFSAWCSADLLILEGYRNKGIYGKMTDFVLEDLERMGAQHFFSFNATPLNAMISLSMGWKSVGQIKIMKKQFQTIESRAMTLAKKLAGPYARKLLRQTGILKRRNRDNSQRIDMICHNPRTQLPPRITIDDKPKPAEMALLVNSTLSENKITQVRDEMFFRWRYNNPLSKYLFLYWYDDGLKGYLVLQSHIYSMESGGAHNIFELEATDSSIKIELLNTLISLIDSGSISTWVNMLDRDSYDFLVSKGFKEDSSAKSIKNSPRTILIRLLGKDNNKLEFQGLNLLDSTSWDYKMIYLHDF